MQITAFDLAQRFVGIREVPGATSNPAVLAMLRLDNAWPAGDDVAWCSAFVNYVAWLLRLPRSKNLAARSWLLVGAGVPLTSAEVGFDVVVLKRGAGDQPGPATIAAPGHVGFYAGLPAYDQIGGTGRVLILGGNQNDSVSVESFPADAVLGVRRIG